MMRTILFGVVVVLLSGNLRAAGPTTHESPKTEEQKRLEGIFASHRLKAGEILKHIPPAEFDDPRGEYLQLFTSGIDPNTIGLVMQWDGKLHFWTLSTVWNTGGMLSNLGLKSWQWRAPPELASLKLPGDWTFRKGASMEEKIAAFTEILKKDFDQDVVAELKQVELDGLLVQGKFVDQGPVHLVVGKPDPVVQRLIKPRNDEGSLRQLLEEMADVGAMPLLDQTAPSKVKVKWVKDNSFYSAGENPQKMDELLRTVADQTGLTFTREKQVVRVWVFRFRSDAAKEPSPDR